MTAHRTLATIAALSVFAGQLHGYMAIPIGVSSNLLPLDDRLIFAQADDSLTVLNLRTGAVIARLKDRRYGSSLPSGKLILTDHGVLMVNLNEVVLLDRSALTSIWEAKLYDATVSGERIVYQASGRVRCRAVSDGELCWSYEHGAGNWYTRIRGQNVIVTNRESSGGEPGVVILALGTGETLFKTALPPEFQHGQVFLGGERVYVERFRKGKPRGAFTGITVWDLSGGEAGMIEAPPDFKRFVRESICDRSIMYTLGDMVFCEDGRAWPKSDKERTAKAAARPRRYGGGVWHHELTTGSVAAGSVRMPDGEWVSWIELKSAKGEWVGVLPYLESVGGVDEAVEADGKLLIGTDHGQVECIDVATGRSLWIYVFPALNRTMSYSSPHGLPPRYAESAAAFGRWNSIAHSLYGVRLLPPGVSPQVKSIVELLSLSPRGPRPGVIYDPEPMKLFEELPLFLAIAWFGALFPLAALTWSRGNQRKDGRSAGWSSVKGLALFCVPWATLRWFGRVSLWSGLTMKASVIVVFCFALWQAVVMFRQGRRTAPVVVLALLGYMAYRVWPMIPYG